jgi:hypothetical protein
VLPELYSVGDAGRGRVHRRPIEGRGGDVDGAHAPALPGEPERVAPSPQPRSSAVPGRKPPTTSTRMGFGLPLHTRSCRR